MMSNRTPGRWRASPRNTPTWPATLISHYMETRVVFIPRVSTREPPGQSMTTAALTFDLSHASEVALSRASHAHLRALRHRASDPARSHGVGDRGGAGRRRLERRRPRDDRLRRPHARLDRPDRAGDPGKDGPAVWTEPAALRRGQAGAGCGLRSPASRFLDRLGVAGAGSPRSLFPSTRTGSACTAHGLR